MKKIGFLSFGHWTPSPQSQARSAADVLLQSIDLAMEAERLGMDGAYFRVHHFAQQLASPFPLLAAVGAKTRKIEIGTAVIDMRYETVSYTHLDVYKRQFLARLLCHRTSGKATRQKDRDRNQCRKISEMKFVEVQLGSLHMASLHF